VRKVAKEYRYLVWTAGVLTSLSMGAAAQDPAFSQFFANPLYMNPAMAGLEGPTKIYLGYRNQWARAIDPYSTYHASYDQYLDPLHGGIGFHVINDRQGGGIINTISVDAIYAYHLKVSHELTVTGGFQLSVGHRNRKTSDLVLPSDILGTPGNALYDYSVLYPDFAVGFGAFYKNFYGGIAAHHLMEPNPTIQDNPNSRLARKYTAHIGAIIPIYEKRFGTEALQLSPNLVFIQQDIYQQLNYGLEVLFKGFVGGFWFRQDLLFSFGTLIFSAGYGNGQYRVRYSYDVKLSRPDLHIPTLGSHEISVVVLLKNINKSTKHRAIKSPKI
jgi:type IX secretion system PorP/SprF family membrane protein